MSEASRSSRRILVIDDNLAIHEDFKSILLARPEEDPGLDQLEAAIFGETPATGIHPSSTCWTDYELDFATQGEEGYNLAAAAVASDRPYALAFVDMRMPPGWNGLETIARIWDVDPDLQVIICTAYSDFSHLEITRRLGRSDNLLILKKPFDPEEVAQMTVTMLQKGEMTRQAQLNLGQLEQLVCERTEALARAQFYEGQLRQTMDNLLHRLDDGQSKLIQSEKLASIGHLAAGVAHEVNNPMGFIRSNLGTLSGYLATLNTMWEQVDRQVARGAGTDTPWLQELREFCLREDIPYLLRDGAQLVDESLNGAERIKIIVENLSKYARNDVTEAARVDLNTGIQASLDLVWNALASPCELVVELGELPMFSCLPSQLNQVFTALLLNAVQAVEGPGRITITTTGQEDRILITVQDTGRGIDPGNLPRVFDPFFTTKPVGQGTGLGLSVAQNIVQRHGGNISVKSEVGRGSTFTVELPLPGLPQGFQLEDWDLVDELPEIPCP